MYIWHPHESVGREFNEDDNTPYDTGGSGLWEFKGDAHVRYTAAGLEHKGFYAVALNHGFLQTCATRVLDYELVDVCQRLW